MRLTRSGPDSSACGGQLDGRVVLVTGGAGGIGAACAAAAHSEGARIVIADRDPNRLAQVAASLHPERCLAVTTDIADAAQCDDLAQAALRRFGKIDGAVFAAGIARHVALFDLTRQQWDQMIAVHLTSLFLCTRAVARVMGTGGGALVYIASTVTDGAGPRDQTHYVAAKAGAVGFVRASARELGARGIRINAVSPGYTATALNDGLFAEDEIVARVARTPLGRIAVPADVAGAVVFLLGSNSSFITGQTLRVDGGADLE